VARGADESADRPAARVDRGCMLFVRRKHESNKEASK
jgi:hypothetical protein